MKISIINTKLYWKYTKKNQKKNYSATKVLFRQQNQKKEHDVQ